MKLIFETDYDAIAKQIEAIDPIHYAKTRNYINGAVTYLSPYISRGVISTKQVLNSVLERGFEISQIESFVKELAWRDYFQRVWQEKDINLDIKHPQEKVSNFETPIEIPNGSTGIQGIDNAIKTLYETGYMHNHCRMYTASLACNIAQSHWKNPAKWMFYHLLDGDWASNACSWQWVAGSNSGKKYFANQENISKYTITPFQNSFLNADYEELASMGIPEVLKRTTHFEALTVLPQSQALIFNTERPSFIYNYYNLDPLWHADEPGNRILLLEPATFQQYPISSKCLDFMLNLSKNIPDIQVFVGSFEDFQSEYQSQEIYFKEHPLNRHYKGIEERRDWISEKVTGYFPSFFAYWKVLEKEIKKEY
jgi:deoxyribodipyrimidine photo-lyase